MTTTLTAAPGEPERFDHVEVFFEVLERVDERDNDLNLVAVHYLPWLLHLVGPDGDFASVPTPTKIAETTGMDVARVRHLCLTLRSITATVCRERLDGAA